MTKSAPLYAGERVRKRGSLNIGTIERISHRGWVTMNWDDGLEARTRPLMCTLNELERI